MGNQQSFDFEVGEELPIAFNEHAERRECSLSAGWRLHAATRKSTGERVSALRFDKEAHGGAGGKDAPPPTAVLAAQRAFAQTRRLRHPLSLIHISEPTRPY